MNPDMKQAYDQTLSEAAEDPLKLEYIQAYGRFRPETQSLEDFREYVAGYESDGPKI